jgi:hypothetical protein
VLSHEAIIDALWDVKLKQVLLERFPNCTPAEMKEAHSYAYGGAILQDMGYYPHSSGYFSDLTHYARSGDFILALLDDAQTLNEYAFALGALSHYAADNNGHQLATNIGEPQLYPKLRKKFGDVVTYEDAPYEHLRTEYGFDVEQVAKGNYAPEAYHDFIGFNVALPLLERAFRKTYGFELKDSIGDLDEAVNSYRHTLSTLIPFFTRVAWADHQDEIQRANPGVTKAHFLYVMSRSSYEREWGRAYDRPSFFDRIIAFILKLLPPVGPLRILKFRPLTPEVEQLFMKSFDLASARYHGQLQSSSQKRPFVLDNTNFDTGTTTHLGQYRLQDLSYAYWLGKLEQSNFSQLTASAKADILTYYKDLNAPNTIKRHGDQWAQVTRQLAELQSASVRDVQGSQ